MKVSQPSIKRRVRLVLVGVGRGNLTMDDVERLVNAEKSNFQRGLTIPKLDHSKLHYQEWKTRFKSFSSAKGMASGLARSKFLPISEDLVIITTNPELKLKMERARIANSCGHGAYHAGTGIESRFDHRVSVDEPRLARWTCVESHGNVGKEICPEGFAY